MSGRSRKEMHGGNDGAGEGLREAPAGATSHAASATVAPGPAANRSQRFLSVDALRGFTIFWIVGGDNLVGSLVRVVRDRGGPVASAADALGAQFQHVPWEGFRFYDLIFPQFIFITGVAIVLSLGHSAREGHKASAYARLLRRVLVLVLLGVVVGGGVSQAWPDVRLMGVLQRIGIAYLAAAILFLNFDWRGLVAACAAILAGYWAVLTFVPVPGLGHASYEEAANLARWIDAHYLPGKRWYGDWDPEGLLSTLPAVATCLMGVLAGLVLTAERLEPRQRALALTVGGLGCLLAGHAWGFQFPVIKKLWTSSFVLVAGGWSLLALGVFYAVIDVAGIKRWATVFVWVGANAIALYLVQNLVGFEALAKRLAGGSVRAFFDQHLAPGCGLLVIRTIALAMAIFMARALYRRGLFLRV